MDHIINTLYFKNLPSFHAGNMLLERMSQTIDYAETNKQTNKSILEFMALKYFYFFLWYVQGVLTSSIYFSCTTDFSKFVIQALVICVLCILCPMYWASSSLTAHFRCARVSVLSSVKELLKDEAAGFSWFWSEGK